MLHCGECVKDCPFGVHRIENRKQIFKRDNCYDCGKNIEMQIPYVPGYNSGETENIAEAIASAIFHAVDKVSKEAFFV